MFVFNVKVNGSKIFKYFFIGVIILLIVILGIVMGKVFGGANNSAKSQSCLPKNGVSEIQPRNYTSILKTVHENIDSYVGKKICFTGYVYRVLDLQDNQFVLARDMIVSSNSQSVVVGFLCHLNEADKYENGSWVEVEGTITKGDYHGEIPVIEITSIKEIKTPSDEYVYPPDNTYIPTSAAL